MSKKVILICEACLSRNYKTRINQNRIERLVLNKYCSKCQKKTVHKETK